MFNGVQGNLVGREGKQKSFKVPFVHELGLGM